jgi:hypothetical protein
MSRPIKPIDRTAPRFRKTSGRYCVISRELFKRYKEKYPESRLTYKDFSGFLLEHVELITEEVCSDRDGVKLPYAIGNFFIGACKPKSTPIDYKKSQQYGIQVKANNFETNGLLGKIFFTNYAEGKRKYKIANRKVWGFAPARRFKLKVSGSFKKNFQYYKEVHQSDKIWKKVTE